MKQTCDVFETTRALTYKHLLWKSQEGFQTKTSFFELKKNPVKAKKMYGEKNLHKKDFLGEKSNSSHIWPCAKLFQSLLVSHLLIDFYFRICDLLFLEFTI